MIRKMNPGKAASNGSLFLDDLDPAWYLGISLSALDLDSPRWGILGQWAYPFWLLQQESRPQETRLGAYSTTHGVQPWTVEWLGLSKEDTVRNGFDTDWFDDLDVAQAVCHELWHSWADEIRDREEIRATSRPWPTDCVCGGCRRYWGWRRGSSTIDVVDT